MVTAVVPVDADFLRPPAQHGEPEEEPMVRAVKAARGEGELAELAPDRAAMELAVVTSQRGLVAVKEACDRPGRQLAVLECARDSFAHQRVASRGVAREDHASRCEAITRVVPADWKGLVPDPRAAAAERQIGEGGAQLVEHRRFTRARLDRKLRALIVDSDVQMRPRVDQARERPSVALDSRPDAVEVEAVGSAREFRRAIALDRHVDHQGASDRLLAAAEGARRHAASGAVRTDHDLPFESAAIGQHARAAGRLFEIQNAAVLDNLESALARRAGQPRVEAIAPDDRAQHFARAPAATELDLAGFGARQTCPHFDRGYIELEAELFHREHGLRDEAAGADLGTRMARLFECDN